MTATLRTHVEGDSSQSSPPAYGQEVTNATRQITADTQCKPLLGPAGNGKFYFDEPGEPAVGFRLHPKPGEDPQRQPWVGVIYVKCGDVPLLMREGFHWTTANVIREEGFMENINPKLQLNPRYHNFNVTRNWFMQDWQQPPRWTALIEVHSLGTEVASQIQLGD